MVRRILKIDKEDLENLYVYNDLSSIKIGELFGFRSSTILRALKKNGIKKTRNSKIKCNCLVCNKTFYIFRAWIKRGQGKYCSNSCSGKGIIRKKRGRYTLHKKNPTWFKKGRKCNNKLDLPEKIIKELYLLGLTTKIIGDIFNTDNWLIAKRLQNMGIDTSKRRKYCSKHRISTKKQILVSSYSEMFIANWLFEKGIEYTYDKKLPNSKFRYDFYIPSLDLYIEYFGLTGKDFYDKKTSRKTQFYKANNLKLLAIFPKDNIEEILSNNVLIKVPN